MPDIQIMKALTVLQPWASLKACGAKLYETRSWATKYRGPIAIHAGLAYDNCFEEQFDLAAHAALKAMLPGFTYMHDLPRGCVIATAELVGCHKISQYADGSRPFIKIAADGSMAPVKNLHTYSIRDVSDDEILFGDFTPGRYAWEFANMQMLPEPIPARGKQGLWNWEVAA